MGESDDAIYCLQCHSVLIYHPNIRCRHCVRAFPGGFRIGREWGRRGIPQLLRDRLIMVPNCQRAHLLPAVHTINGPALPFPDLVGRLVADVMADLTWLRRICAWLLLLCLGLFLWRWFSEPVF